MAIARLDTVVQEKRHQRCCSQAQSLLHLNHHNEHAVNAFLAKLVSYGELGGSHNSAGESSGVQSG